MLSPFCWLLLFVVICLVGAVYSDGWPSIGWMGRVLPPNGFRAFHRKRDVSWIRAIELDRDISLFLNRPHTDPLDLESDLSDMSLFLVSRRLGFPAPAACRAQLYYGSNPIASPFPIEVNVNLTLAPWNMLRIRFKTSIHAFLMEYWRLQLHRNSPPDSPIIRYMQPYKLIVNILTEWNAEQQGCQTLEIPLTASPPNLLRNELAAQVNAVIPLLPPQNHLEAELLKLRRLSIESLYKVWADVVKYLAERFHIGYSLNNATPSDLGTVTAILDLLRTLLSHQVDQKTVETEFEKARILYLSKWHQLESSESSTYRLSTTKATAYRFLDKYPLCRFHAEAATRQFPAGPVGWYERALCAYKVLSIEEATNAVNMARQLSTLPYPELDRLLAAGPIAEFISIFSEQGYAVVDVPGDGNCLFYAVLEQLQQGIDLTEKSDTAEMIRSEAVATIRGNPHKFLDKIAIPDVGQQAHSSNSAAFEHYLNQMSTTGTHGDYFVIEAIAMNLKRSIIVYTVRKNERVIQATRSGEPSPSLPPIRVALFESTSEHGNHFMSIYPPMYR